MTPDEELTARVVALLDEVRVPYMVAGSLAILAKLGGSERQIQDVEGIVAIQGHALDRACIERWAAVLGVTELWRQVLEAQP